MKKGYSRPGAWLLCTLLLGGAVGCGVNEQDIRVQESIETLKQVTTTLGDVRKYLNDAVAKPDSKDGKITPVNPELAKAESAAEKLPRFGEGLQRLKERIDRLADRTSPESRDELARQYRQRFIEGVAALVEEEGKVQEALSEAEKLAKDNALDRVRKSLQQAREAFEVLTKQR